MLPAHTKIPVRVTQTISSHDAVTESKFAFVVAQDVLVNGVVAVPKCTAGVGTITLAGKHGINGHEGDLHLRFDTLTDGSGVELDPAEQQFAGKQRKALAFMTSRWINGDDVEVTPSQTLYVSVAADTAVPTGITPPACPALPAPSASP